MKKSIPIIRERESEAFILGNGREREFPLTPDFYLSAREPSRPCPASSVLVQDDDELTVEMDLNVFFNIVLARYSLRYLFN